ncbi:MAG: hypothetical protein JWQ89_2064 [Devosia sp.]|nr:hypothetical protein [Devosia sp.]
MVARDASAAPMLQLVSTISPTAAIEHLGSDVALPHQHLRHVASRSRRLSRPYSFVDGLIEGWTRSYARSTRADNPTCSSSITWYGLSLGISERPWRCVGAEA